MEIERRHTQSPYFRETCPRHAAFGVVAGFDMDHLGTPTGHHNGIATQVPSDACGHDVIWQMGDATCIIFSAYCNHGTTIPGTPKRMRRCADVAIGILDRYLRARPWSGIILVAPLLLLSIPSLNMTYLG